MRYISIKEASEKWQITPRRIQHLCKEGQIHGVKKYGRSWMIPFDCKRPVDRRTKEAREKVKSGLYPNMPMPKKAPFLDMTDLYVVPGTADKCIEGLAGNPEAQKLFAAEIAYSRGEIDKVYEQAKDFLKSHSGFYAVNAGGMLLGLSAMWKGDINLWREAKQYVCTAPCTSENDMDLMALSLASLNTAIHELADYPEWFKRGCFEHLPYDAYPSARVFYAKYLLSFAQALAKGEVQFANMQGLALMNTLPFMLEPMIAQSVVERMVIPEIYLRLIVASAYYNTGAKDKATGHIDKAIALALPDRLFGLLAEHRSQFDYLLDERLKLVDVEAYNEYVKLHKKLSHGWAKLHNELLDRRVSTVLSAGEREVARLAAFGLRDKEIAERINVSLHTVKSRMTYILSKTGAKKRSELGLYI